MLVYKRKMTAACQPENPVVPEPNETAATASSSEGGGLFSGLIGLIWGKPCAASQDKENGSLLSPWCQDETSLITQSNTKLIQDEQVGHRVTAEMMAESVTDSAVEIMLVSYSLIRILQLIDCVPHLSVDAAAAESTICQLSEALGVGIGCHSRHSPPRGPSGHSNGPSVVCAREASGRASRSSQPARVAI